MQARRHADNLLCRVMVNANEVAEVACRGLEAVEVRVVAAGRWGLGARPQLLDWGNLMKVDHTYIIQLPLNPSCLSAYSPPWLQTLILTLF